MSHFGLGVTTWGPHVALSCLTLLGNATAQRVHRVPSEYPTIQSALNAAGNRDTVLVAAGTYQENLRWPRAFGLHLLSEEGPQRTIIDGGRNGTVVLFARSVSRSAILEGFTITNGYLDGSTVRAYGAGIKIDHDSCEPTIRGNVISGNEADGPGYSYGAGLYLSSLATPRIEYNVIEGNVGRGDRPQGTGIYVHGRSSWRGQASAEIVGNIIRNNVSDGPRWNYGAGVFCDRNTTVLLAGNLIVKNECRSGTWDEGAGIYIYEADATIVNNTIADNIAWPGSNTTEGGGILINNSTTAIAIFNNVVASNTGGGINVARWVTPPAHQLGSNVLWQNAGGNYVGIAPGATDRTVDPLLSREGSYHLTELSPCIDTGDDTRRQAVGLVADIDGDPRPLAGNTSLGGGTFTVDVGADEYAVAHLVPRAPARMGMPVFIDVNSTQTGTYFALLDVATSATVVPPLGVYFLSGRAIIVSTGPVPGTLDFAVPLVPQLAGIEVYVQALVRTRLDQLTNRVDLVLH